MRITDIQIGERHRKDMGDIEGLARSIDEIGLLHPVVVRPDGTLVAGERRIKACQMLGWLDVPVTVIDLAAIVRGECDENQKRKDWTPTEAVAIAKELEPLEREAARERYDSTRPGVDVNSTPTGRGAAMDKVADAVGMSRPTLTKAQEVMEAAAENPELFGDLPDKMDDTSIEKAYKEKRKRERESERAALAATVQDISLAERWHVEVADLATYNAGQQFDFIITDPPYPQEFLPLYGVLAQRALDWLKPGGLLLAMCGQSYLDRITEMMSEHLEYYWTGCYLTPGQPTPLRTRQVNTTWKPILAYIRPGDSYKGKIFGDVWVSEGNDKEHHHWGQSESGMLAMIRQVVLPGQSIFDPFCGAGTTGVAALMHGCTFTGIDIDGNAIATTTLRLSEVVA